MSASGWGRWTLAVGTIVVAVLVAEPRIARAHARLVRSEPAAGGRLSAAPTSVELWFDELLDREFNTITVFPVAELASAHRSDLAVGAATVDPADATHLSIALTPMPPGTYIVEYRVLSRDGHSAPGRFSFQVGTTP